MTGLGPWEWLAVMLACVVSAAAVTGLYAWARFGSGKVVMRSISRRARRGDVTGARRDR
ncbi:hypothetical protein ACTD5D_39965 [Nocardia takedensis]|uniref:hypothetical protein n=1 Tax=Nocardia takedensis TaxID=259390 RepID=UPI003F7628D2